MPNTPKPDDVDVNDKLFLPDPQPDSLEITVRACCGALVGVLLGFGVMVRLVPSTRIEMLGCFMAPAVFCTWASARYGDRFWTEFLPRVGRKF